MLSLAVIVTLLVLMLAGVSIAVSIGLTASVVMLAAGGPDLLIVLIQRMWSGATAYPLLAVPFFILAGNLMNTGGVTRRIFAVAQSVVGGIAGGLAHVVILAAMLFAGMTGSAVAEAAGLATVSIKAMSEAGYTRRFAAALVAASSTIGPIIPPSIPFVIYGSLAGVSVGRLFLAGFLPGVLMGAALMAAAAIISRRMIPHRPARLPVRVIVTDIVKALPAFGMPVIIIGGILGGAFTPTEASAVAALYGLFLGLFVDRELKWSDLPDIFWATAKQTVQVLLIIAVASAFGWIIVQQQIPNRILSALLGLTREPWAILLLLNVALLIMGCFLETIAIMIITMPIFLPLIAAVGISPEHFGVVMVLNLMIGLITPPVGVCLFAVSAVSGIKVSEIAREVWPYVVALVAVLAVVTYAPNLILWLPNAVMGDAR